MNVTIIDNPDQLFAILQQRTIDMQNDGLYAAFMTRMRMMRDPKICACKKGAKAQQVIDQVYVKIAGESAIEPLATIAHRVLGAGEWQFRINGSNRAHLVV